jgi:hypothetical protein
LLILLSFSTHLHAIWVLGLGSCWKGEGGVAQNKRRRVGEKSRVEGFLSA